MSHIAKSTHLFLMCIVYFHLIVSSHAVIVDNWLWIHVNCRQAPMHPKMDRNKHQWITKQINFFGPSFDSIVTSIHQSRIEKCWERINWSEVLLIVLRSGHDHLHVEVDHLVVEPVQARERVNIFGGNLDFVSINKHLNRKVIRRMDNLIQSGLPLPHFSELFL